MRRKLIDLAELAEPGTRFDVRVTPGASADRIFTDDKGAIRVHVTAVPENGKATAAVIALLAKAIGVPKSQLTCVRGETARDKSFLVG
ncbi:DUF167 domain-containing protein [Paracoccus aurantiacus]|uniref:UPF0235 protein FQV27_08795 n=1 Tax=Paracoccus aurantiacus TaxID=2599412 RepID=A0A5C6S620_9RHOB|nr:DUF167 domain-containing protein [Paracoccus aurantiacus]TXB69064.1 DUF167 domain-containing protein [Paracoccus aurantiacus]